MPKTIKGLEVFSTGVITDSTGESSQIDGSVLDHLVAKFAELRSQRRVPVKLGHTTEAFNRYLSGKLNVPDLLLTGEHTAAGVDGQARLGTVDALYRTGEKLLADLVDVPDAVAELIKQKMFSDVSSEVVYSRGEDGSVQFEFLKAIALLGGEVPAVPGLQPADEALMFCQYNFSTGITTTKEFQEKLDNADEALSKEGFAHLKEFWSNLTKMFSAPAKDPEISDDGGQQNMDFTKLLERLGLKKDASSEDILTALQKEEDDKAAAAAGDDNDNDNDNQGGDDNAGAGDDNAGDGSGDGSDGDSTPADDSAVAKEIAELKSVVETQSKQIERLLAVNDDLEQDKRVAHYTARAQTWTSIPGTAAELGKEIAEIHKTVGEEAASRLASAYDKSQEAAQAKHYTESMGTSLRQQEASREDPFNEEVKKYAEDNKTTYERALVHMAQTKPMEFRAFHDRSQQG